MPDGMWRNLGNALRLVREVRRKSQESVAREAGVGKSQLSKYENGRELPKLDSLEKVLNALDVGLFEFFYTLHIVDSRADDLIRGTASAREAVAPALGVPPLSALNSGKSLLSADTEQLFASLMAQLLGLYRTCLEQTLKPPDPLARSQHPRVPGQTPI